MLESQVYLAGIVGGGLISICFTEKVDALLCYRLSYLLVHRPRGSNPNLAFVNILVKAYQL
jgi:hypothetical protein